MITVLMSVYFGEQPEYLRQSLSSLVSQLSVGDQVIIVEDGPISSNLSKTIDVFRNQLPIDSVRSEKNIGLAQALNLGIKYATEPWIIRFDSDDICNDDRIRIQKNIILENQYDFFGGQIVEFDELNGRLLGVRGVPLNSSEILRMLPQRNPFNHVTMCIRRELLLRYPYPDIPGFEDYALWATLVSNNYSFTNLDRVLVKVRAGPSMLKRRSGITYILREIKLRQHILTLSFFSVKHVIWYGFLRCASFCLPLQIKSFIYKRYLRN